MKQLLRRLALAMSLVMSLTAVLSGGQLVVIAPAHAVVNGWPPNVADGGICEDGIDPFINLTRCPVLVTFLDVPTAEVRFYLTTRPGFAQPGLDYVPLEREPAVAFPGAPIVEVAVWIVSDGRCEAPETFTLELFTDDPTDAIVAIELEIIDTAC